MKNINAVKILLKFILKRKIIYLTGIATLLITSSSQVLSVRAVGWIIDFFTDNRLPSIFGHNNKEQQFLMIFSCLFFSYLFLSLGRIGWRYVLARQTHHATKELLEKMWDSIRFFPERELNTNFTKGALMNAATSDVNRAKFLYGFTLTGIFDVCFMGFFTIVAMVQISWELTVLTFVSLFFVPFLVQKVAFKEMTLYRKAQETLSLFNDLASQAVTTIRMQRITQTGFFWVKRLIKSAEHYRKRRLKAVYTSLDYYWIMGGGSIIANIVLFTAGLYFIWISKISIGDFVAIQGLVLLLQDPMMELGFVISDWKKGTTSLERIYQIIDGPIDEMYLKGAGGIDVTREIISIKDLSFTYDNHQVLNQLSLNISKGDRIGVMGPIGSGKSTLINIISGLEKEYCAGTVLFMGKPFKDYSYKNLRNFIGVVPQKTFLFSRTIRENINIDQDLSDEQIWHYLKIASVHNDVAGFPDGLDTSLGEWGINLSGGQKQRLTLARAISRRPSLLLLDDCLSAVDTVTEEEILTNLDTYLKETSLVWVAHRKSTLKNCDRIINLGR